LLGPLEETVLIPIVGLTVGIPIVGLNDVGFKVVDGLKDVDVGFKDEDDG
jgi:hypothetical protein